MNVNLDISEIKDIFLESKKYLCIYLILILLSCISMLNTDILQHPKMVTLTLFFIVALGIIFIAHYIQNKDNKNFYITVFVVLLIFGLITSVIIPINSVSDEGEHLIRSEITSRGILFPEQTNGSYLTIASINTFYQKNLDYTFFNATGATDKIDYTPIGVPLAFEQNPFIGYIFSGLGILFSKMLDLNVIWMLWLGRIFNAIVYSALISFAVKIMPKYKMLLFSIACLPTCLFQACSVSIDSFIFSLSFFIIAYFVYLYETDFNKKHVIIFTILCLLVGLCKLPYLSLIFLLFFLPKNNFKDKNYYLYVLAGVILLAIIGFLWSRYSTEAMTHSWRVLYQSNNNISIAGQIQYIISNPKYLLSVIQSTLNDSSNFESFFNFYTCRTGPYHASHFVSILLTLFYGFICLGYPKEIKFSLKTKLGILLTTSLIYFGTYFVFLLSWTPVGQAQIIGVHARYFLPLFALLPLVLSINENKTPNIDKYVFTLTICFISTMIISFLFRFY